MAINVGDKIYASTLNSLNYANLTIPSGNAYDYIYSYSGYFTAPGDVSTGFGAGRYRKYTTGIFNYLQRLEGSSWVTKRSWATYGTLVASTPQPTSTAGKKLRRLIRSDAWRTTDGAPYYSAGAVITAAQVNANQIVANG